MKPEPVAGHPTHLRVLGHGARPVLALHCSLAHGGAWGALAAELGDALAITAPDLPGHGASGNVPPGADLHDLSTAIAAELARRIGGGAAVDVLGHSFGGTVALRLALQHPGLVRSLTLFEPVLFCAARDADTTAYDDWMSGQAGFDAMIANGQLAEAAEWFNTLWGQGARLDSLPPAQRRYIIERIPLIPATKAVLFDDREGLIAPGRLESLHLPVLLAEGATSPPIVAAVHDTLTARLPAVHRTTVAGAGHMLPLTHARDLAPHLRAHLGLPSRG